MLSRLSVAAKANMITVALIALVAWTFGRIIDDIHERARPKVSREHSVSVFNERVEGCRHISSVYDRNDNVKRIEYDCNDVAVVWEW